MKEYKLNLAARGIDWICKLFIMVLLSCNCVIFMGIAIFVLIVEHNLRKSFGYAMGSLFSIIIGKYYWDIYVHFPHAIFFDEEKRCIYLKTIFGKLSAIPMREIHGVKTHFWFLLIYFPAFIGYIKVNVAESSFHEGFFIISPFFKNRKELLDRIL
jgi:hypothetical protein